MLSWIKKLFALPIFNDYSMINANYGDVRDPLKQDLALHFCRNQNKGISILTETYTNLNQIPYKE